MDPNIPNAQPLGFGILAIPTQNMARFQYGIGPEQVVRYQAALYGAADPMGMNPGDGIGIRN